MDRGGPSGPPELLFRSNPDLSLSSQPTPVRPDHVSRVQGLSSHRNSRTHTTHTPTRVTPEPLPPLGPDPRHSVPTQIWGTTPSRGLRGRVLPLRTGPARSTAVLPLGPRGTGGRHSVGPRRQTHHSVPGNGHTQSPKTETLTRPPEAGTLTRSPEADVLTRPPETDTFTRPPETHSLAPEDRHTLDRR